MKKLSIYAMIASILLSAIYAIKLQWFIETDFEFWRATAITGLGEIGLWCFYYYSRDYEAIKAQEEHSKRVTALFTQSGEKPEQSQ